MPTSKCLTWISWASSGKSFQRSSYTGTAHSLKLTLKRKRKKIMAEFKPTEEQIHVIKTAHSGETFVVDAVAGSGKTTTARKMCEAISGDVLYLVYNRAAADDARSSFPRHVKVSTTSALAWHEYKETYGDRMRNSRVPARRTAELAGIKNPVSLGD